jgi:ankyrin repeat protein
MSKPNLTSQLATPNLGIRNSGTRNSGLLNPNSKPYRLLVGSAPTGEEFEKVVMESSNTLQFKIKTTKHADGNYTSHAMEVESESRRSSTIVDSPSIQKSLFGEGSSNENSPISTPTHSRQSSHFFHAPSERGYSKEEFNNSFYDFLYKIVENIASLGPEEGIKNRIQTFLAKASYDVFITPDGSDEYGCTLLHDVAELSLKSEFIGKYVLPACLQQAVKLSCPLDVQDARGYTFLHIAATVKEENIDISSILNIIKTTENYKNYNVFLNCLSRSGATALFYAINSQQIGTALALLNEGISPSIHRAGRDPKKELNALIEMWEKKVGSGVENESAFSESIEKAKSLLDQMTFYVSIGDTPRSSILIPEITSSILIPKITFSDADN